MPNRGVQSGLHSNDGATHFSHRPQWDLSHAQFLTHVAEGVLD
jgi:hypothetical protein